MRFTSAFVSLAAFLAFAQARVPLWGQCGGTGYEGETTCATGSTCVVINQFYSQCQPTGSSSTSSSTTTPQPQPTAGLHQLFKENGKAFWGVYAEPADLSNPIYARLVRTQFGLIVTQSIAWDSTEPSRGSFVFSSTDALFNQAISSGKPIWAEPLIWHSRLPSWVSSISDASTLTAVIQNHITALVELPALTYSYMPSVDCGIPSSSEPLNEDGSLRSSVFSRVLGENYIRIAFAAARAADPTAKLYISDYNLVTGSGNSKMAAMNNLVNKVNSAGVLIDGIGIQAHLPSPIEQPFLGALQFLTSAGVDLVITELEVTRATPIDYLHVVRACLSVARCIGITSWRAMDGSSWNGNTTSALFDATGRPKPAYTAIIQLLGA
ncbi:hypothetical protein AX16_007833 [Volvariella volvacea WC 439]|nr:hypothetical protein AX16_007833 [Volvariella volvacea WC 439]